MPHEVDMEWMDLWLKHNLFQIETPLTDPLAQYSHQRLSGVAALVCPQMPMRVSKIHPCIPFLKRREPNKQQLRRASWPWIHNLDLDLL
jgi:hypothetical protein